MPWRTIDLQCSATTQLSTQQLDGVEFFWVCKALGQDAKAVYAELADAFISCK